MKSFAEYATCIFLLAALVIANPFPQADSSHDEAKNFKGSVTCPSGWVNGTDANGSAYCFNCGLPDHNALGCPACINTSCSRYATSVCKAFSGHPVNQGGNETTYNSNCTGIQTDKNILVNGSEGDSEGAGGGGQPVECHQGGDKQEITGIAYLGTGAYNDGEVNSNMCGYLLNNCPSGLYDQAVIYRMGPHPGSAAYGINDPSDGQSVTNNDFSNYATNALKLQWSNAC